MTFTLSDTQKTVVMPLLQEKYIRGRGYVTVSAKGLVNGLSNIPNDGADFGPDTTLGATTTGQWGAPYTTTEGRQEAVNYASANNIDLVFFDENLTMTGITVPSSVAIIQADGNGGYNYSGSLSIMSNSNATNGPLHGSVFISQYGGPPDGQNAAGWQNANRPRTNGKLGQNDFAMTQTDSGETQINASGGTKIHFLIGGAEAAQIGNPPGGLNSHGGFILYNGLATEENGFTVIRGTDSPRSVTAPDSSPINMVTFPSGGPYYVRIGISAIMTAYTSGTLTYTATYTLVGGHQNTVSGTLNSVNGQITDSVEVLIEGGSTITIQVTGTFVATAYVGAIVEVMTAGA